MRLLVLRCGDEGLQEDLHYLEMKSDYGKSQY